MVAILVKFAESEMLVFSIYMSTNADDVEHLPEFTACLANVSEVIDSCDVETCLCWVTLMRALNVRSLGES